jgi:predicted NBD/HSP70 family sugar kinase
MQELKRKHEELSPDPDELSLEEISEIVKEVRRELLTWDELKRRQDELGSDPDQLTLEEISEIVKEVRQELRSKK